MDPFIAPASNGFFSIVWGLGWFAKIDILILIIFSVISWAIILKKFFLFRRIKKSNEFLYILFHDRKSVMEFSNVAAEYSNSLLSKLVMSGIETWHRITKFNQDSKIDQSNDAMKLLPNITDSLDRTALAETEKLEQNLGFLATCGSVAPFLGLLGTVWGILGAFLGVRHIPVVTLQIIAPGISDALVTTVVGLLVAIPAVVAYNYFVGRTRNFTNDMERWSLEIVGDFRASAVKLGKESQAEK